MPSTTDRRRPRALPAALRRTLEEVFGIETLRDGQEQVIRRVLAGEDTLALMPAGAGKSLCYQLPALHLRGTVVVVSPLIALMRDQADKLAGTGVGVDELHSAVSTRDQAESMHRLRAGRSEVVFLTPERLADPEVLTAFRRRRVALFVVDEAHCISQWGHDFRPAYLQIGRALRMLGEPPVLALTATAPPGVVDDIRAELGRPALAVVDTGLYRANLRLQVVACVREDEKLRHTLETLHRHAGPGIVYTATVKACEALYEMLRGAGESVTRYHGKLRQAERTRNQAAFMTGAVRVMVATNAFGMGVDKPDLRFVLHWQMPGSPQAYYQEAGRAGRDGKAADAALLFDRRDKRVQQFFLVRRHPTADELERVHTVLARASRPLALPAVADALADLPRGHVAVALEALLAAHAVRVDRHRAWAAGADAPTPGLFERVATAHEERAERDRAALERMVFYAQTGLCRWRVLLEHFGETPPFAGGRCGHCDNCVRMARATPAGEPAEVPEPAAAPRFPAGAPVRVPRFGHGEVTEATADEVEVRFSDGSTRRFVADYVTAEP